jgi:regulator of nucleoside diphosphate kinase
MMREATPIALLSLWGGALVLSTLLVTSKPRLVRALGTWSCALWLLPLASGTAAAPIYSLMFVLLIVGAALLLNAPTMSFPPIIVSKQDVERLERLIEHEEAQREVARALGKELARADVLPPTLVPSDVVTMNSRVVYEDVESGRAAEAVLVYPDEADTPERVSILSPIGSALLGLRTGQAIDWRLPTGRHRRIRVLSILYQPEAAGHFHL